MLTGQLVSLPLIEYFTSPVLQRSLHLGILSAFHLGVCELVLWMLFNVDQDPKCIFGHSTGCLLCPPLEKEKKKDVFCRTLPLNLFCCQYLLRCQMTRLNRSKEFGIVTNFTSCPICLSLTAVG